MTRPEAEAIIRSFKAGEAIPALRLQDAIRTTRRKKDNRLWSLPPLPRPVREQANATLLLNLGMAMGRSA